MQKITAFPFTSKMTFDEKGWPQLDRGVTSEVLRKVLKNYYTNGVFGINDSTCLQVAESMDDSTTVKVKLGVCLIQGATGYMEDEVSLELAASDTLLPRIDTVVARLNDNMDYRAIYLDIIPGTPASTPQPPALTQSDSIWEIGLANLYRTANSTVITNSDITDTRQDSSRCGYVTAINKLDTESLMQQLNAYYDEFVVQCETDYDVSRQQYLLQCQNIIDDVISFKDATKEEILAWFQEMKDQLSKDAALHLQIQISELKEYIKKVEAPDFDDSGEVEGINSFTDFMSYFIKNTSIYKLFANLKAGLKYVLHAGQLVNNCMTDNPDLPLAASQGYFLMGQITGLYSEIADGITVRYNAETDYTQVYDGENWVNWQPVGLIALNILELPTTAWIPDFVNNNYEFTVGDEGLHLKNSTYKTGRVKLPIPASAFGNKTVKMTGNVYLYTSATAKIGVGTSICNTPAGGKKYTNFTDTLTVATITDGDELFIELPSYAGEGVKYWTEINLTQLLIE